MTAKCATIGTVQEKFFERPTERLNPRPQSDFLGATRGSQVLVQQQLDAKPLLCANREPLPNFLADQPDWL
jgi:hypothetical protein